MAAALLAAAVVTLGRLLGWQGVDMAAQVYRVDSLRRNGFTLWDFGWYGGHWTLDYSLLYPPLARWLGITATTVASAALAALAFDRLARRHLGEGAAVASLVFAAGTLVSASIGQLTFLGGEAFGLGAVWALSGRRRSLAVLLALGATLTSPLTGAFVALAGAAWALDRGWERDRAGWWGVAVAAAAAVPVLVAAVVFPGDGPMPYPAVDWLWEMTVAAVVVALAGRRWRPLSIGGLLYMATTTVSFAVPSALGGNVGRLEDMVALPVALALAWSRRRLLAPVAALPLALSQWAPAWGAFAVAPTAAAAHRSFYDPLVQVLAARAATGPPGRVEVVPTAWHWEAAWVAPVVPLARGWERQLDEADNPIFYRAGALNGASYRAWLMANGVRFVALPAAPLDMAGRAEGRLVSAGLVPGLHLVWRTPQWQLYLVAGSPGIVSGPAELVSTSAARIQVDVRAAGIVAVRVRWTPDWYVASGSGCVSGRGGWIDLHASRPGPVSLELSPLHPGRGACPGPTLTARRG